MKKSIIIILISFITSIILTRISAQADAYDYKVGLTLTIPLNFKDISNKGTLSLHLETYNSIDYYINKATNNNTTNNDTTNNDITNNNTTNNHSYTKQYVPKTSTNENK